MHNLNDTSVDGPTPDALGRLMEANAARVAAAGQRLAAREDARYHSWLGRLADWHGQLKQLNRDLAHPPEVMLTLVGGTGAGKSTLINALLGSRLLATSNSRACTSAVTEISHADTLSAEVTFVSAESWQQELQDYADLLADEWDELPDGQTPAVRGPVDKKLRAAYSEEAVARFYDELDVASLLQDRDHPLHRYLETGQYVLTAEDPNALRKALRQFVASTGAFWPVVSCVRIRGPFPLLRDGAHLVDLPGLNDPNPAREAVTRSYLTKTNFVMVVYNMKRALTREITETLQADGLFRRLVLEGRTGSLAFVGTSSDAIDPEVDGEEFGVDPDDEIGVARARNAASERVVVEQLNELVDELEASSDGSEAIAAGRLRAGLASLPRFSVSARDYLHLSRVQQHRQSLFTDASDTGIPALAGHIQHTVQQNGPLAHARAIGRRHELLISEMQQALREVQVALSASGSEARQKEVRAAAAEATRFLDGQVKLAMKDLESGIDNTVDLFIERMDRGIERARGRLGTASGAWSGYHWATLRAACRHGGVFISSSAGRVDLTDAVTDLVYDAVALAFEDFFGERLRSAVENGNAALQVAAAQYRAELTERLSVVGAAGDTMANQRRELEHAVERHLQQAFKTVVQTADVRIDDERSHLLEDIRTRVLHAMRPAYQRGGAESGSGMKARIVEHLRQGGAAALGELGPVLTSASSDSLRVLSRWVRDEFERVADDARGIATRLAGAHLDDALRQDTEAKQELAAEMSSLLAQLQGPDMATAAA